MSYETKRSAQKTTRHILSSETEWLKNKANREKWGEFDPLNAKRPRKAFLVTRAPWGPHSARGRECLENGRSGGDLECVPKGSAD